MRLSDDLANTSNPGVPEDDDLEGARLELKIGYGQSKWVAEKLLMEVAKRGLAVNIVRPGYVVGDSVSGGASGLLFLCSLKTMLIQRPSHSDEYGRLRLASRQGMHSTRPRT